MPKKYKKISRAFPYYILLNKIEFKIINYIITNKSKWNIQYLI